MNKLNAKVLLSSNINGLVYGSEYEFRDPMFAFAEQRQSFFLIETTELEVYYRNLFGEFYPTYPGEWATYKDVEKELMEMSNKGKLKCMVPGCGKMLNNNAGLATHHISHVRKGELEMVEKVNSGECASELRYEFRLADEVNDEND